MESIYKDNIKFSALAECLKKYITCVVEELCFIVWVIGCIEPKLWVDRNFGPAKSRLLNTFPVQTPISK